MSRAHRKPDRRALADTKPSRRNFLLGCVLIAVLTGVAYVPAMCGEFLWDDDSYVVNNQALRSAGGLSDIWFNWGSQDQYYPLSYTSFWVDYHLWGLNPLPYHIENVLLQIANAILLWLVLRKLAVPGALLAAAIFAVHPVHVESVGWITERKNVLSGLFYMLSALAYLRFAGTDAERPADRREWKSYGLAMLAFALSLSAKTVTCTLPAALGLVLWWKRRKLAWADIWPLVPMLVLGGLGALATSFYEIHFAAAETYFQAPSWLDRTLIAGRAFWFYIGKILFPWPLVFVYPKWNIDSSAWWQYLPPLAALGALLALWLARKRLGKGPLTAALFYAGTILPALGFFKIYYQITYSPVADHFQYLASIGVIVLAVIAARWLLRTFATPAPAKQSASSDSNHGHRPLAEVRSFERVLAAFVGGIVLSGPATLTFLQGRVYRNLDTLWTHTLEHNPECWMAWNNYGQLLLDRGDLSGAMNCYEMSIKYNPRNPHAVGNLASAHVKLAGMLQEQANLHHVNEDDAANQAEAHFRDAVFLYEKAAALPGHDARIRKFETQTCVNLGILLLKQLKARDALEYFKKAIDLDPSLEIAYLWAARASVEQNKLPAAMEYCRQALRINPGSATAHDILGVALENSGHLDEAISQYEAAVKLDANFADAAAHLCGAKALLEKQRGSP